MKKFLILLLAIFTCFNAEAIPITHSTLPAKVAAASAARRQRERLEEKQQHEEEFHHGNQVYDVQYVETFTFKDSVPTIETWEIRKYYYKIDPDKCIIKTEEPKLKSLRPATEQEIKERQKMIDFVFTLVGATLVITIISIILIIYQRRKKKLSIGYNEIC